MGRLEAKGVLPCQDLKENSPTSGLLRFLVARGGIEPPTQGFSMLCSNDCYWPVAAA